jgi:hypothetical protein
MSNKLNFDVSSEEDDEEDVLYKDDEDDEEDDIKALYKKVSNNELNKDIYKSLSNVIGNFKKCVKQHFVNLTKLDACMLMLIDSLLLPNSEIITMCSIFILVRDIIIDILPIKTNKVLQTYSKTPGYNEKGVLDNMYDFNQWHIKRFLVSDLIGSNSEVPKTAIQLLEIVFSMVNQKHTYPNCFSRSNKKKQDDKEESFIRGYQRAYRDSCDDALSIISNSISRCIKENNNDSQILQVILVLCYLKLLKSL